MNRKETSMTNLQALGHYIIYCNRTGKKSQREDEGMHIILHLPEGTFDDCFSDEAVYYRVMKLLT
jgi:hypothetical protein